mgnify:CR=1 FL=1
MATTVPPKYQYDPDPWETKEWLYEQYWGELRSTREIARNFPVHRNKLRRELIRHGIPRRTTAAGRPQTDTSPISGFYFPDERVPMVDNARTVKSKAADREYEPDWVKHQQTMRERGDAV